MCAALKTSLGAAIDRIAKLEKRDLEKGRELTSLKLKLQLPAVTQLGTAPDGAATPASDHEHYDSNGQPNDGMCT